LLGEILSSPSALDNRIHKKQLVHLVPHRPQVRGIHPRPEVKEVHTVRDLLLVRPFAYPRVQTVVVFEEPPTVVVENDIFQPVVLLLMERPACSTL